MGQSQNQQSLRTCTLCQRGELFPKQTADQDAVDAVTRQRDTITRTAADTEVLLLFAQDSDQASTAAPPDDDRDLFGREEALRMDEEIMDFQWFEHVTWDSVKDLRGTTYVQPPTRFRFALQQARHAILRAIIHNNPTSLASESAWKALVLSSWLLLGRPAVNASQSNCPHFLDARLELLWAEDWSALWTMVRAKCDVAPVQNTTRRTDKQQMQSRVRKVATLARTGEKGRAPVAARNAPPVPVMEQIVQEMKSLYPADQNPQLKTVTVMDAWESRKRPQTVLESVSTGQGCSDCKLQGVPGQVGGPARQIARAVRQDSGVPLRRSGKVPWRHDHRGIRVGSGEAGQGRERFVGGGLLESGNEGPPHKVGMIQS